jgi:cell division septation protein DedD
MADDEPDGIQLRGKQLVFQAMSAIVVAVGIFLLGVMVGRGVPNARQQPAEVLAQEEVDPLVPSPAIPPEDALPIGQDDAGPNPTYQDELFSDSAAKDDRIKVPGAKAQPFAAETAVAAAPASERRAAAENTAAIVDKPVEKLVERPAQKPIEKPVGKRVAKPVAKDAGKASAPARSASGFMVQVAAYQRQGEANGVRDRLNSKGYPAFVSPASTSGGTFYRVRVGGYEKEADAKSIAARLKREERLEPWVTR